MIRCMFRRPVFPIIIEIDGLVISARSKQGLEKKLSGIPLVPGRMYQAVDSIGATWDLYVDGMMLSPLTLRKRPTKKELIALVNGRTNKRLDETPYPEKSLSAKTFERVFEDLVNITVRVEISRGTPPADNIRTADE
jgi:hypothetical protein